MQFKKTIVVAGAGGFIGGHLINRLRGEGADIRAVDIKPVDQWHQSFTDIENIVSDLQVLKNCHDVCDGATHIYNLASTTGGTGFTEENESECMMSVVINAHMLAACREINARRYFFASSASVYDTRKQARSGSEALRESDVYPAMPDHGHGWEKLYSERLCKMFHEEFGVRIRVARLHNIYGPNDSWQCGRENVVSALCRKVIDAKLCQKKSVEIWGNGSQTRSFTYIDDCLDGIEKLMTSKVTDPVNLGSSESISINQLVDLIEGIAETNLHRLYKTRAPKGVAGRNSDNTRIMRLLKWQPEIRIEDGLKETYDWILNEYQNQMSQNSRRAA